MNQRGRISDAGAQYREVFLIFWSVRVCVFVCEDLMQQVLGEK